MFINASHHAREYMTTALTLNQIETIAQAYEKNASIGNYNVRELLDEVSIWFAPLVNPDGVEYCINGYPEWKANITGVDLNRNYDARRDIFIDDPGKPSAENYPGGSGFSEPETKAMRDFCFNHNFDISISYHSAGEIIYWNFPGLAERQLYLETMISGELSTLTGYKLIKQLSIPSIQKSIVL